ncbi:MAG TPA: GNAT family N-acetyltransferase [Gaiellales bacterium]|nr:GNAT family N-acetyltransferase [Gaiellales bacterium]
MNVRPLAGGDREWAAARLRDLWGDIVVSRGRVLDATELPGFVAEEDGQPAGLLTYRIDGNGCEVVTIDAFPQGSGAGTALLDAVAEAARAAGCRRVWLITTNDNLRALRFYQRRGFRLAALHRDALDRSRELKPSIPDVGLDGIPLRDELELERPV